MDNDTKHTKSHSYNTIALYCGEKNTSIQNDLRKSATFCDAKIVLEDGGCIPVHRVILCSATEFFHKLFMSPVSAEQNNNYFIKYVRTGIMECVINFAYTFICDINETNLCELLTTAEYFCYTSLVDRCAEYIQSILNVKNCISLMLMTRKWLFKHDIQRKTRGYVLRNFISVATLNTDILSLSCNDLVDIIMDDALNSKSEEPVWELCLRWIEFDEENRKQYVPRLLENVRLGLIKQDYFERRVLNHNYVQLCPEAKPIVNTAHKFVSDLDEIDWLNERDTDISLLVPRLPSDVLFAIGGWYDGSACLLFETYDVRADRWIEFHFSDPNGPRAYHSAAVIGSKIYFIGGYSGSEYYNKCTVFDVKTKMWREIAPMHYRRCYVSVCVFNDRIYAMGGHDGHSRLRAVESYNPETNQWTLMCSMALRRSDADACELNGQIYIVGGFDGSICLRSCEVYNPEKDEWSYIPEMLNARSGLKCVPYNGQVFAVGGYNGLSRLSTCEAYSPQTFFWASVHDMISPRSNFGIEVIDDTIYVSGGFDGLSTINKVEYYRAENNEWKPAAGMNHHRSAHAIAKVSDFSNIEDFVYESRLVFGEGRQVM